MMQNPEMRGQMMQNIVGDHDMMAEFMGKMKNNPHAMQMMQGDKGMMNSEGMNMMNDSIMSMNMMHSMMKDGKMMTHMMQMMHDQGMMSDECMNSCIKMMSAKGMNTSNMHTN